MSTLKRAVEAKIARMKRVPDHREWLNEQNETFNDWYGWCRKCGAALEGSLKELKEHKCGPAS